LGSIRPDSAVQGSEVMYKTSLNDGIWPMMAAFTGDINTNEAAIGIERKAILGAKSKDFDLNMVIF
jgi:hypothetical protein